MRDFNGGLKNCIKNGVNRPLVEALKPVKTKPPTFGLERS